jgi:hypothetical protein
MRDDHQFHPLRAPPESSPGLPEENQGHRSRTPQSGRISPACPQSQQYKAPGSVSTNEYVQFSDDRTVEGAPQWDKPQNSPVYAPIQNKPANARSTLQGRAWVQEQPQVADLAFSFSMYSGQMILTLTRRSILTSIKRTLTRRFQLLPQAPMH